MRRRSKQPNRALLVAPARHAAGNSKGACYEGLNRDGWPAVLAVREGLHGRGEGQKRAPAPPHLLCPVHHRVHETAGAAPVGPKVHKHRHGGLQGASERACGEMKSKALKPLPLTLGCSAHCKEPGWWNRYPRVAVHANWNHSCLIQTAMQTLRCSS